MSNSTLSKKSTNIVDLYKAPAEKPKIMALLIKLLRNVKINEGDITTIIEKYTNLKTGTDIKIFNDLVKLIKHPENLYSVESDTQRACHKWRIIKSHLTKRIHSYLDMGGNVGNTAMVFGRKIFKLPKEKTFVVDIDEWAGEKWVPRDDITFIHYDKMATIPDRSIDMISAFHTLHHIPSADYPKIMKEFYRILSNDGCIVLYEHNCEKHQWAGVIDIEHAIFDVVVSKKITFDKFVKIHYAKYLSINKWKALFASVGFKDYFIEERKNIDNSFFIMFRK